MELERVAEEMLLVAPPSLAVLAAIESEVLDEVAALAVVVSIGLPPPLPWPCPYAIGKPPIKAPRKA